MVIVTGARGSVGSALAARLPDAVLTDIDTLDVTDEQQVADVLGVVKPDVIFHLAAAKHAPDGEADPEHVLRVNASGTANVLRHAGDAVVVVASTCKACDPETAYGASKLIAERMTLNAGQRVVRFYNIPESSGNVFRLWEQLPEADPVPWTDCWRYFASMEKSVDLLLRAANLPSGRYAPDPGGPRWMRDVAAQTWPGHDLVEIPRRRGDRRVEPLTAACEHLTLEDGHMRIASPHDPRVLVAA